MAMASQKRKLDSADYDDRKVMRRMKKRSYETKVEAKQLWNELRNSNTDSGKMNEVSRTMFNLVVGKASTLVYAHDTSRVIQTFIKVATPEHRATIFEELKDQIILMMKSKFSKFVIRKFMKYGSKEQKLEILGKIKGNVLGLLKHKEASEVVEYIYNDFANVSQRNSMEEEFYGPAYALHKDKSTKNLIQFVSEFPDKKDSVVQFMKEKLNSLIEKNILQLSFVHKLFNDFFIVADNSSRSEMIEALHEDVANLIHTKQGSRVAMKCLWYGTAKDRKLIVKGFKSLVVRICKEEFGHFVLLALFDCVDDTKLVQKALLDELVKNLRELGDDQYGRKVLLYLLTPRNPLFFHPDVITILSEGDGNEQSKKEKSIRQHELLSYVSEPMMEWVAMDVKLFAKDNSLLLLLSAIITNATGNPCNAMRAVAKLVAEPFVNSPNRGFHFVDDTSGHMVLKKLIENDENRKKNGESVLFSIILMDVLSEDNLRSWINCNRGCFIIVKLLELDVDVVSKKIKTCLGDCKSILKKYGSVGAQILLKKL